MLAADFSDRLGRGETAPIQVLVDGSDNLYGVSAGALGCGTVFELKK